MVRGFFGWFVFFLIFWSTSISRFWIFLRCGFVIFLMEGIFFFFTGTILVPVEIEYVPGFSSLPSLLYSHSFHKTSRSMRCNGENGTQEACSKHRQRMSQVVSA